MVQVRVGDTVRRDWQTPHRAGRGQGRADAGPVRRERKTGGKGDILGG